MLKVIGLSSSVLNPSAALIGGINSEGSVKFIPKPVFHMCLLLKLYKLIRCYVKWWYVDGKERWIVSMKIKLNVQKVLIKKFTKEVFVKFSVGENI